MKTNTDPTLFLIQKWKCTVGALAEGTVFTLGFHNLAGTCHLKCVTVTRMPTAHHLCQCSAKVSVQWAGSHANLPSGQRSSVNLHSLRSPWWLRYLFSSVGAAGEWFGHSQIICDITRWVLTLLSRLLTANIKTHNSVLWKHVRCEHKSDPHQRQIWPIISIHLIQTSVLNINPKAPQVLRAELGALSFQSSWWVPFYNSYFFQITCWRS